MEDRMASGRLENAQYLMTQTTACQLLSTIMQLLFSFDQDVRVEKTLIQTLASQLSSTLIQVLFSFDQDKKVEKLSYKLSLLNSHQLLNYSSGFNGK